jgi:glycyl-tRNA synthetase beta subunit
VVRPRLADAEFFFNTDRKKRLEDQTLRWYHSRRYTADAHR